MKGDLATVKKLLEKDPALLEARDDDEGVTPLAYAAGFGRIEVFEFLVARGANVNARDSRGLSALHLTVYTGQLQALRFLLDKGADVKLPGPSGMSPLHSAATAQRKNAEIAGSADPALRTDSARARLRQHRPHPGRAGGRPGPRAATRRVGSGRRSRPTLSPATARSTFRCRKGSTGIADYLRRRLEQRFVHPNSSLLYRTLGKRRPVRRRPSSRPTSSRPKAAS